MNNPLRSGWVAWEADGGNGYGHIAERFNYHMLQSQKIHFVNAYNAEWECMLCLSTPAKWMIGRTLQPRPDIIFHTMFEATPLPPGWVDVMNCAGLIWTPSQWSVDQFIEQGVTTPIIKAGYAVNHYEYEEVDRSDHEGPMRFVLWADTLSSRKNVLRTVKAFIDAGLPDAQLDVKLHSFAGMNLATQFSDAKGRPLANISIHTGVWPRSRIAKWLQEADCGLYLSGGEGFGLIPLEEMATGLPVICTNNTGMLEYLRPDNHIPIACPTLVEDVSYTIGYGYKAMTHLPDWDQVVDRIRWAYYHRDELHDIGHRAALQAQTWNWEDQSNLAVNMLYGHFRGEEVDYARHS